jgi:hypothetical protein
MALRARRVINTCRAIFHSAQNPLGRDKSGLQTMMRLIGSAALIVPFLVAGPASAQRAPGSDGQMAAAVTPAKANAGAAPPTAQPYDPHDLTGVWMQARGGGTLSKDVSFTPEYAKIFQMHADAKKAGNPYRHDQGLCVPAGIVGDMTDGFAAMEILARGDSELLLNKEAPNAWYRIFLKRQHKPSDELFQSFYGDSVGHWEGDVLVVDTIALKDGYWLDSHFDHIPYSDQLHVVQRFERVAADTLRNQLTIEDPKAFTKPYTVTVNYKLHPDWELTEAICTNERNVFDDKGQPTVKASEVTK